MSPMARNGSTSSAGARPRPQGRVPRPGARYFHGALKPPFNEEKRAEAGLPPDFYWPLAEAGLRATDAAVVAQAARWAESLRSDMMAIGEIPLKSGT
jgi:hypothetical protein